MVLRTEQAHCQGSAGNIDYTVDYPASNPVGWSLVLHPHPLYGGTKNNKVVTTVARACVQGGLLTIRPNFRGIGASEGQFDNAIGETADMVQLVEHILSKWPEFSAAPFVLAGFSFGSAVAAQLYAELADRDLPIPKKLVLIGCAVERFRYRELLIPENTILIHGDQDEVVPFTEARDFALAHQLSVNVIPEASHFFHGNLLILRQIIKATVESALAPDLPVTD